MRSEDLIALIDHQKALTFYLRPFITARDAVLQNGLMRKGKPISNPFLPERQKTPSFCIFQFTDSNKWGYKDHATGETGDVISLVQKLKGVDFVAAMKIICEDFNLDFNKPWEAAPEKPVKIESLPEQKFVDNEILIQTMHNAKSHLNEFIGGLYSVFGEEATNDAIERYFVGTNKNGHTVFWYVNKNNLVTSAKVMAYRPFSKDYPIKRDKNVPPYFQFKTSEHYYPCLFGEHLIPENPKSDINIVEAEKTAIIASIVYPDSVWIATGGSQGLTDQKALGLTGLKNKIFLISDFDDSGRKSFEKGRELLANMNLNVHLNNPFPEITDGTDLADIILTDYI